MFTGIVEETGTVKSINISGKSGTIVISADKVLKGTSIGDSIAVNGICLTVTAVTDRTFSADIMAETVRRSSLSVCHSRDKVNLERAMPADGRFGGHIVSGHIDGTGIITSLRREENAVWVTVKAPAEIMRYIVEKGSICIDGISLTVACADEGTFSVSVIPHTGSETTLLKKHVGEPVNLENDIISKYVEKFMHAEGMEHIVSDGGDGTKGVNGEAGRRCGGLTMDMLREYDF